jgi:hypothetical protein
LETTNQVHVNIDINITYWYHQSPVSGTTN